MIVLILAKNDKIKKPGNLGLNPGWVFWFSSLVTVMTEGRLNAPKCSFSNEAPLSTLLLLYSKNMIRNVPILLSLLTASIMPYG